MKHPSHLHLDWSPAETFGNASDLHERLVQSAYPRSHLMKCVGKRPPLHICKSHLPLSSNCRRRVSFLFCNMSCYPLWVWQVRLTFVNSHFTSFSLGVMSSWPRWLRLQSARLMAAASRSWSHLSGKMPLSSCWYFTELILWIWSPRIPHGLHATPPNVTGIQWNTLDWQ